MYRLRGVVRRDTGESNLQGLDGAAGEAPREECEIYVAANAVALEHAVIALVRVMATVAPEAAARIPETMTGLSETTLGDDPAHQLARRLTNELASRLSVMIEDWTPRA